jgi:hypothetical protein
MLNYYANRMYIEVFTSAIVLDTQYQEYIRSIKITTNLLV